MFHLQLIVENSFEGMTTVKDEKNNLRINYFKFNNNFDNNLNNNIIKYLNKNKKHTISININYKENKYPIFLIEEYLNIFKISNDLSTFKEIDRNDYKCFMCNDRATWHYTPINNSNSEIKSLPSYFCEKHIEKKLFKTLEITNKKLRLLEIKKNSKEEYDKKFYISLKEKENDNGHNILNNEITKNVLNIVQNNKNEYLKKFNILIYHPGKEYKYSKNGFLIFKNSERYYTI